MAHRLLFFCFSVLGATFFQQAAAVFFLVCGHDRPQRLIVLFLPFCHRLIVLLFSLLAARFFLLAAIGRGRRPLHRMIVVCFFSSCCGHERPHRLIVVVVCVCVCVCFFACVCGREHRLIVVFPCLRRDCCFPCSTRHPTHRLIVVFSSPCRRQAAKVDCCFWLRPREAAQFDFCFFWLAAVTGTAQDDCACGRGP